MSRRGRRRGPKRKSCDYCQRHHTRCNGRSPCDTCTKLGEVCRRYVVNQGRAVQRSVGSQTAYRKDHDRDHVPAMATSPDTSVIEPMDIAHLLSDPSQIMNSLCDEADAEIYNELYELLNECCDDHDLNQEGDALDKMYLSLPASTRWILENTFDFYTF